ncbi:centrosomal protein of 55 kDa-like isoform X6 [Xyrichtys novacula]|uniref:Centrosomal protein of 55 kDa-like isoform X6 n=1 Tax=Xyrichtys novacula TaxID=13765 RepID=A0AAV1G3A9_XYRNO|nr:centrosomal protein of 55 kDa-like isoform X6 [Xyrichtys novacula]
MVPAKYRVSLRKKLKAELEGAVSILSKENDYLKKTLNEFHLHYSALNKLLEGSTSDEDVSTDDVRQLESNLKDALEKNKQWLEYDQQREAYVRAILDRMLWLEKQLNEANQACLQRHNERHSDEKDQIRQMQEHYETLLLKANDKLELLRYKLDRTSQNLIRTQNSCKERESEVEELRRQLQTFKLGALEDPGCAEDLRSRLDEERRKSANLELQADIRERFFKNGYQDDQKRIADLERQREQQDHIPGKVATPPSPSTRDSLQSFPHNSLKDESCLECPICQTQYPAHQYRDLIYHLDVCHD